MYYMSYLGAKKFPEQGKLPYFHRLEDQNSLDYQTEQFSFRDPPQSAFARRPNSLIQLSQSSFPTEGQSPLIFKRAVKIQSAKNKFRQHTLHLVNRARTKYLRKKLFLQYQCFAFVKLLIKKKNKQNILSIILKSVHLFNMLLIFYLIVLKYFINLNVL